MFVRGGRSGLTIEERYGFRSSSLATFSSAGLCSVVSFFAAIFGLSSCARALVSGCTTAFLLGLTFGTAAGASLGLSAGLSAGLFAIGEAGAGICSRF